MPREYRFPGGEDIIAEWDERKGEAPFSRFWQAFIGVCTGRTRRIVDRLSYGDTTGRHDFKLCHIWFSFREYRRICGALGAMKDGIGFDLERVP